MYNKVRVISFGDGSFNGCATSLVGFRSDNNPIYEDLWTQLKIANSGYYVNDLPAVSFEVIQACLSEDAIDANDYLTKVYESSVISCLDKFVNKVKSKLNSKELLSNQSLVAGVASFKNKVTQNARFVGYYIRPAQANNLSIEITKLGFQSTQTQSGLRIYLYETSQNGPINTFNFDILNPLSLGWMDIENTILTYQSENGGTGQEFLLGYYENDPNNEHATQLQGQALYMTFDCRCPGVARNMYSKYAAVSPIELPNSVLVWNGTDYDLPYVDNFTDYLTNNTYGLTAKINAKCDITDVLCQNINMFGQAVQLTMASRILYDAYASNRINSISDSKRADCKNFAMKYDADLNGYTTAEGIKVRGVIDTLSIDFSSLDKVCLPCKETGIMMGRLVR